ncbi:MAG: hypothetical protein ABIH21_00215 [Patescibacteria group bacterium]
MSSSFQTYQDKILEFRAKVKSNEMLAMYAVLLAAAQSITHLEHLHRNLPANCKLLRKEHILLCDIFKAMQKDRDACLVELLAFTHADNTLADYYLHQVNDGRVQNNGFHEGNYASIAKKHFTADSRGYYGYFDSFLFGIPVTLSCWADLDSMQIVVRIFLFHDKLIEEATYLLKTKMPVAQWSTTRTGRDAKMVDFLFRFLITEEEKGKYFMDQFDTVPPIPQSKNWYIRDGFFEWLQDNLNKLGVPVESINARVST